MFLSAIHIRKAEKKNTVFISLIMLIKWIHTARKLLKKKLFFLPDYNEA